MNNYRDSLCILLCCTIFIRKEKSLKYLLYIFFNNNPLFRDYLNLRSIDLKLPAALHPQTSGKRKYLPTSPIYKQRK